MYRSVLQQWYLLLRHLINSLRESKSNGAYILLWNTFSEKRRKLWRLKTLIKKLI